MNPGNEPQTDREEAAAGRPRAWLPLTPRGIAAFGMASYGRLLTVQLIMGLLAGLVVASLVRGAWYPPVAQAIRQLPVQGDIINGRLNWTNMPPAVLAGNRYLAVVVDLNQDNDMGMAADLQIELSRSNVVFAGFLGAITYPYPASKVIAFNRRDLEPWWGAWSQAMLAGILAGTCLGLMVVWAILAFCYIPFARVTAWMFNLPLRPGAAWRLAGAALMPGALLLTGAIYLYGWGVLDLVRLGFLIIFHFLVGWIYLPLSVLCVPNPNPPAKIKTNPFAPSKTGADNQAPPNNPFTG